MSTPTVRAITTRYSGHAFRSRLEARYAVYFDHLGIRWDYEPEGFELGNGLRYLPDFWLPEFNLWVEIKPSYPDKVSIEKASRLGQGHRAVIIFCGPPRAEFHETGAFFGWDQGESSAGFMPERPSGHFAHYNGELALEISASSDKSYYSDDMWEHYIPSFEKGMDGVCWERAEAAATAAREARFEFGAKGGL